MVLITNEAEVIMSDSVNSANNQQANNAKLKQMNLSSFIKPITAEKRLEDVDLESLRMDLDKVLRDEPPKAAPTDKKSAARIRQQKSRKRKEIQEVDDGIRDPVTMKKIRTPDTRSARIIGPTSKTFGASNRISMVDATNPPRSLTREDVTPALEILFNCNLVRMSIGSIR
jgi:hypothetical protein